MSKIAVIDCGIGNVKSVVNACQRCSENVIQITSSSEITDKKFSRVILPGVGAVGSCIETLSDRGFSEKLKQIFDAEIPFLGICVGMQILATTCEEFGTFSGLNLIPGKVSRLGKIHQKLKLPHVGWNSIHKTENKSVNVDFTSRDFYFVHSYKFECDEKYSLYKSQYGEWFNSAVRHKNIFGVQFHPEKSSSAGEELLASFIMSGEI